MLFSLFLCPYSKTEERMAMEMVHDFLYLGFNVENFEIRVSDYPVPRTSLGSLVIATLVKPFFLTKIQSMYFSRSLLTLFVFLSHRALANSLGSLKYRYLILASVQHHSIFYASRFLPNTFGLILTNFALAQYFGYKQKSTPLWKCAFLFGLSLVFRMDIIVICCVLFGYEILKNKFFPFKALIMGLLGLFLAGFCSFFVDSFVWGYNVLPEFQVFLFNVIQNKSVLWGSMPFHFYFSSSIPMMTLFTLIMFLSAIHKSKSMCFIIFGTIFVFSLLQHKETRFIHTLLPLINIVSSKSSIWNSKIICFVILASSFAVTVGFSLISSWNYYGGAITNHYTKSQYQFDDIKVDLDVHHSGISRFLMPKTLFIYQKNKDKYNVTLGLDKGNSTCAYGYSGICKFNNFWFKVDEISNDKEPKCLYGLIKLSPKVCINKNE